MEAMGAARGLQLRVVVSTDLMARGVDLERYSGVWWWPGGRWGVAAWGSPNLCTSNQPWLNLVKSAQIIESVRFQPP